jgi:hypothetical protein
VIRLHTEQHRIDDYSVASSMVTGLTVGDSIVARVQGQSASCNITEIRWARAIPSVPSDQAASVARGEFHPRTVEYSLTNEPDFWWKQA